MARQEAILPIVVALRVREVHLIDTDGANLGTIPIADALAKAAEAGLDLVEVRDVLWTFTAVEFYELLVLYRGWSLKRYEQWTAQGIIAALL